MPTESSPGRRSRSTRKSTQGQLCGTPVNGKFCAFRNYAIDTWEEEHGAKPAWGQVEFKMLKLASQRIAELEELKHRWSLFLDTKDGWLKDHNPKIFTGRLDLWKL